MIIITGVSKGLGKALAIEYLSQGEKVIGIGRSKDFDHANFHFMECDLSNPTALAKFNMTFLSEEQEIIFIHNAGIIGEIERFSQQKESDLSKVMQVNLFSGAEILKKILLQVDNDKKLSVAFISSGASTRAIPSWAAYCASKAAVNLWLEAVKEEELELGRKNFKCIAIAPGVVDTAMQEEIRSTNKSSFSMLDAFVSRYKNNELISPKSCAQRIRLLIEKNESNEVYVRLE